MITCYSVPAYKLKPKKDNLEVSIIEDILVIWVFINSNQKISNYEFIDGFIQIRDNIIELKSREMSIFGRETKTNYVIVDEYYGDIKDTTKPSFQPQDIYLKYLNKQNNFSYKFEYRKGFSDEFLEFLESLDKNNNNVIVNLRYKITVGEEVFEETINEEYNLRVTKGYITIFHYIIYIIGSFFYLF
jgi:hypothetical protein